MDNATALLSELNQEFTRRRIECAFEDKQDSHTTATLITTRYLGNARITVDEYTACYVWLCRSGVQRRHPVGNPSDTVERIIGDRAGTLVPPEKPATPTTPPVPLPRRGNRHQRPLHRPDPPEVA